MCSTPILSFDFSHQLSFSFSLFYALYCSTVVYLHVPITLLLHLIPQHIILVHNTGEFEMCHIMFEMLQKGIDFSYKIYTI